MIVQCSHGHGATVVDQDILLDCGTRSPFFEERTTKSPNNWTRMLVRSGIEKAIQSDHNGPAVAALVQLRYFGIMRKTADGLGVASPASYSAAPAVGLNQIGSWP